LLSNNQLQLLVAAVYDQPELTGCIVGFQGGNQSRALHPGIVPALNYGRVMVIVEETTSDDKTPPVPPVPKQATVAPTPPAVLLNRSRIKPELVGAGLSCGLAVVSMVGVFGSAAAEVPTGGASTVLLVLAWTGMVTSAIQCVNGVVRSAEALSNPDSNSLQVWDENEIYSKSMLVVDAVGVVSAVASLPFAVRNLLAVLERRGGLVTAEKLFQMTREEREAAVKAAVKQASRTPEGAEAVQSALRDAGLSEKQAAQTAKFGAHTARRAKVVARVISEETARRLHSSARDIIGGVGGAVVSGMNANVVGSASGSVNYFFHVLARE
jgi:hypothetical protein